MPLGRVVSFSAERGLGELTLDDGRRLGFHATAIAGGGRSITPGARVAATVAPSHGGLVEAVEVEEIDEAGR